MDIYRQLLELASQNRRFTLGVVVAASGSTPQRPGSKAILDESGALHGTLGGGLVEAEGILCMRRTLDRDCPELFEYRLDADYARDAGPICGGLMRIFANPHAHTNAAAYQAAVDAFRRRERGVIVSHVAGPAGDVGRVSWLPEGDLNGHRDFPDCETLRSIIAGEQSRVITDETGREVFVEPVIAPPRLLVVGGGHVGQEVVRQAVRLGFDVTVIDDRAEFVHPSLFPPGAKTQAGDPRALVGAFPQDSETFIILVSKGHRPDAEALEGCIHGNAAYIGMIGSRRKIRFLKKHFLDDGLATREEWARLAAPIGFDIGAVTVPEIGVSIAAQLIAARRLGKITTRAMHERL